MTGRPHRRRRSWSAVAAVVALSVLLAACADSDSNRRFANDPIPTEDLLAQPTVPVVTRAPEPTEPPATPATTQQMLGQVGTPQYVFVQVGKAIIVVPTDGSKSTTLFDAKQDSIIAFSASNDGSRIAILTADAKTGSLTLRFFSASGEKQKVVDLPSPATPAVAGFGRYRLAWSPSGDRVLLSLGAGGIIEVLDTGEVRTILEASAATSPRAVTWSPSGNAIAYVDAGANGDSAGLYVASTDVLPVDPITVIRPTPGRSRQIQEIAWASGDLRIVYSERSSAGDLSVGGDLFRISASGGTPELVAAAGGGQQAAAVGSFALSPDGRAIAFTVLMPADTGQIDYQLFVQQIDGPSSIRLTTERGEIGGLVWTASGLAWTVARSVDAGQQVIVQRANADGTVVTLFAEPPLATPVASPAVNASPVATPVTPKATP